MIVKALRISTRHITLRADELLNELYTEDSSRSVGPGVYADKKYFGHILTIADDDDPDEEYIDPSIERVVKYARLNKCEHVIIDRDAETDKHLPQYEW